MTDKEAMKLALEALKITMGVWGGTCAWHSDVKDAIKALEEALAKQEQRNVTKDEHNVLMKALAKSGKVVDAGFLAKQEQGEPVGEVIDATDNAFNCAFSKILPIGTKLYTAPQPKQEQGEPKETYDDPCPDCGKQLQVARGGGVKCSCGYWFCF